MRKRTRLEVNISTDGRQKILDGASSEGISRAYYILKAVNSYEESKGKDSLLAEVMYTRALLEALAEELLGQGEGGKKRLAILHRKVADKLARQYAAKLYGRKKLQVF